MLDRKLHRSGTPQHRATIPTSTCFLSLTEKIPSQEPSISATLEGGCRPKTSHTERYTNFQFCYMTLKKEMLYSLFTSTQATTTVSPPPL